MIDESREGDLGSESCPHFWSILPNRASHFSWFTLISLTHSLPFCHSLRSSPPTFFTVSSMIMSPTGMRMPPRMVTRAPNTAPAISPHLLLQHPMAWCVRFPSFQPCEPACLPACLSFCFYVLLVRVPAAESGCTIGGADRAAEAGGRCTRLSQRPRNTFLIKWGCIMARQV